MIAQLLKHERTYGKSSEVFNYSNRQLVSRLYLFQCIYVSLWIERTFSIYLTALSSHSIQFTSSKAALLLL